MAIEHLLPIVEEVARGILGFRDGKHYCLHCDCRVEPGVTAPFEHHPDCLVARADAATEDVPAASLPVLAEVADERILQDRKWGEQNHDPEVWLAILIEEVGELATGMLRSRFPDRKYHHRDSDVMRTEAIQVAAVAVNLVECLDRKERQAAR